MAEEGFEVKYIRAQYPDANTQYPGLDDFKIVRKERDYHYGEGAEIQ